MVIKNIRYLEGERAYDNGEKLALLLLSIIILILV